MKKLKKGELKTIKGGNIPPVPIGCNSWDFKAGCCREWDSDHWDNPTCPY
ncbi:MAG: hypothetical protein MUW56_03870 [Chryseobacterium sp.]|nr:hypothetical protein [Chryseobacterium sp.]MCJ7932777.1 hypothetical protein [Chryseobacterium sp.]